MGESTADTAQRHAAASKLALALGFGYRPTEQLAEGSWAEIAQRMEVILPQSTPKPVLEAALGLVEEPKATFGDALKIYCGEIFKTELAGKSEAQLRKWRVIPERAIRTFVEVVGDKPLSEIKRSDAVKFYRHWLERIQPSDPSISRLSPSSGNRQLGELRKLYRSYFDHVHDEPDRSNPFRGLSFKENDERKRPAFSDRWIIEKFIQGDALRGLNSEARAVLFAMIETGARPSELCNLRPESIVLNAEVPHVAIVEHLDADAPRQLKSTSSRRYIPLVGVALKAFQAFPEGFPRYREREESLSATINKYFSDNGLRESNKHSLYSLRHSFENRMLRADFDVELRIALFGHKSQRPVYGDAGGLNWKAEKLRSIAFSSNASIFN
ncbi:tyrosine-type recombinase/integrase [Devosia soli]|nr:tyrosine-type recombinase/integrase [Devosia soli]